MSIGHRTTFALALQRLLAVRYLRTPPAMNPRNSQMTTGATTTVQASDSVAKCSDNHHPPQAIIFMTRRALPSCGSTAPNDVCLGW
jgi:hypothetical protein